MSNPGLEGVVVEPELELENRDDRESDDVLDEVPMTSVARPGEAVSVSLQVRWAAIRPNR